MNKTDLSNIIAEKTNLSKAEAKNVVDVALEAIANSLLEGDKVTLLGFGTFAVAEKTARTGFNPRTKETIEIPARRTIKFKPATAITDKL